MDEWQPIETAIALKRPATVENGKAVLVCNETSGKQAIGVVFDFTGDDGRVRRGIGSGFGIFEPTHWMPLPAPPVSDSAAPSD